MPFGLDRYFDRLEIGNPEDHYNAGYNVGYNDGQNAGLKEGLKTGEINGAFDEARRIARKLKKLDILTQEQISEVTGVKFEHMI